MEGNFIWGGGGIDQMYIDPNEGEALRRGSGEGREGWRGRVGHFLLILFFIVKRIRKV